MSLDIETIQPGWRVVDVNGDDIGTILDAAGHELRIKKSGFLGGEIHVPTDAVAEIETGRVELNRAKDDLA
jgi:hypothetical protein